MSSCIQTVICSQKTNVHSQRSHLHELLMKYLSQRELECEMQSVALCDTADHNGGDKMLILLVLVYAASI